MSASIRSQLYAVLAAVSAIVVAYGLITESRAALWVALGKTLIDAAAEPWTVVHGHGSLREARERAAAILASLGMEGDTLLRSRVRLHLSGGQRQRVAVVRALILAPELLLCDEPTSMQDASTRMDVVNVLLRAVKDGAAMVFVTHDLALASRVADRVVVLYRGRIVETGNAREVLASPRAEYTKLLVGALPRLERESGVLR